MTSLTVLEPREDLSQVYQEVKMKKYYADANETICKAIHGLKSSYFGRTPEKIFAGKVYGMYNIPGLLPIAVYPTDMRFHRNWNWIMFAVKYINDNTMYRVHILPSKTSIYHIALSNPFSSSGQDSLSNTFNAVFLWAQWHLEMSKHQEGEEV